MIVSTKTSSRNDNWKRRMEPIWMIWRRPRLLPFSSWRMSENWSVMRSMLFITVRLYSFYHSHWLNVPILCRTCWSNDARVSVQWSVCLHDDRHQRASVRGHGRESVDLAGSKGLPTRVLVRMWRSILHSPSFSRRWRTFCSECATVSGEREKWVGWRGLFMWLMFRFVETALENSEDCLLRANLDFPSPIVSIEREIRSESNWSFQYGEHH